MRLHNAVVQNSRMMQSAGLGLALIPPQEICEHIRNFVGSMADDGLEFSFALDQSESVPHVSVFQSTFESPDDAIAVVDSMDRSMIEACLHVSELSIWATRILFLNFALPAGLKRFHRNVFREWRKRASRGSADPQFFTGITQGQQASYDQTGYPFSLDQYLPHITLAHLKDPTMGQLLFERKKPLLTKMLPPMIHFEKLVAFTVEPLGICTQIRREWKL